MYRLLEDGEIIKVNDETLIKSNFSDWITPFWVTYKENDFIIGREYNEFNMPPVRRKIKKEAEMEITVSESKMFNDIERKLKHIDKMVKLKRDIKKDIEKEEVNK